ncbi:MAG: hypothetical protein ABIJ05_05280 [Patescibacteria group bacterium]
MSNRLILRILKRSFEYFIIGMVVDLSENMLVIKFATKEVITWQTVKIAFLVVLPFAILMELVFDPIIRRKILGENGKKKK